MNKMVNFGIDLGTSNSLIAKFDKGNVEVFKNPNGFKETLPSIVGFRNDRILIGDQAKSYSNKDPKNVASRFKRNMGTTEMVKISSNSELKTPIELSAFVLKELKTFIHTGEKIDAAVITIPASFDTVQSNATKQAGIEAGFKYVLLLQEPIAASLAYANKEKNIDLRNSQWIVYDLGGGTFDVALVNITEGELNVVDHEGDNYLGGTDFDALIVEKILVPELNRRGNFTDLLLEMKSESGKYNSLWHQLLSRAEEAKIELSSKTSAEIDLGMVRDLVDDNGDEIDSLLTITRSELEELIKDLIDNTANMLKIIMTRKSLQASDVDFILMVGGSTYIPYVRKRIEELMGIPVNTSIDPTNAIAVGAAFYAGRKEIQQEETVNQVVNNLHNIKIRIAYNKDSQEAEETFTARVDGETEGLFYRIIREDGAFDSGLKTLSNRIIEDLPLREGAYNSFEFKILDSMNNLIDVGNDTIQIAQGRYSVAGQMLPEDISLVKDDISIKDTILLKLFSKNSLLPVTNVKQTVDVGKTIIKDSNDEIRIIIVEGPSENHSSTNKPIGALLISGKKLSKDLMKGTEIDLTFEMSESRDLKVSAHLVGTGQSFSQVFNGKIREVHTKMLAKEILHLETKIQSEIEDAVINNKSETAQKLDKLLTKVQNLYSKSDSLSDDDVTNEKFKLEDSKRDIAKEVFKLTSSKRLESAKSEYSLLKQSVAILVRENGNDKEKHQLSEIMAQEAMLTESTNPDRIQTAINNLERLEYQIRIRMPDFLIGMFDHLVSERVSMNDQLQSKQLIENGKRLILNEAWDDLRQINLRLWDLLPENERKSDDMRLYTNII